ncbi:MAG: EamA family transporter [Alphaproteobacteria bacterium]|nr:EamA family transporter [Alphaproteobacteria bacterium]
MPFDLAVLVLIAAAMHASWNALIKGGRDPLTVQVMIFGVPAVMAVPLIPILPLPDPASWPFLAASTVIHVAYYISLAAGYRVGDLSLVYPIARGIAPVLVTVLALAFEGEVPTPIQLVGVALVSLGIISLGARRGGPPRHRHAIFFAILTGICISAYTVSDGMGVRRTAIPLSYIAWLFLLQGFLFATITVAWRGRAVLESMRLEWRRGVFGGVISALSYTIVIWVMSLGALAPISALRETSVIIAALLGTTLLGEPFGRARFVAAIVVCAGAALLSLAG